MGYCILDISSNGQILMKISGRMVLGPRFREFSAEDSEYLCRNVLWHLLQWDSVDGAAAKTCIFTSIHLNVTMLIKGKN